ncbi:hypothetical protein IB286_08485 [Spongiibacter sp. KMU-158]|uniref:Semialdehyde dehydrogenase dimerisation domain-containing protein n=1 Tax=Spongiibacter pelagi TaxID=2760804 RepID=A0A927C3B3_9GAMM|nr:Asd/ArgC dimerization domain-containing protein [Spongiibacter pelagi]MBD2859047.1 hypothetical protein [Spongiibacter pelagi]
MRLVIFGAESLEAEKLIEGLSELEYSFAKVVGVVDDAEADIALYKGRPIRVEEFEDIDPQQFDIGVFLAGSAPAKVAEFFDAGKHLIDASGYLAEMDDIPLYGSGETMSAGTGTMQIAVADAVSAQVSSLLQSVEGIRRVDVAVQQPASVLGRAGVETLAAETARLLNGMPLEASSFNAQIAFNCQADSAQAEQIESTLQRLLADKACEVYCSVAVVPVFHGHLLNLALEFDEPPVMSSLLAQLQSDERVEVFSAGESELTPVGQSGQDTIAISAPILHRRKPNRVQLALCADNLRKGVAFNIIEALNSLIKNNN